MPTQFFQFERFGEKSKFYFKGFPYVDYDILGDGNKQKIKNFLKRYDFKQKIKNLGSIYIKWVVRDEDTPQVIAHKLYNSTHYYWIVLMINSMLDPTFSFPMAEPELYRYTEKKYGVEHVNDVHHYESIDTGDIADLPDGIIVDSIYPHRVTISNIEYEVRNNDNKRKILMLKPEYLEEVISEVETIMKSGFTKVK